MATIMATIIEGTTVLAWRWSLRRRYWWYDRNERA
jgi:hypothetical protein